jgi:hypothetical protein
MAKRCQNGGFFGDGECAFRRASNLIGACPEGQSRASGVSIAQHLIAAAPHDRARNSSYRSTFPARRSEMLQSAGSLAQRRVETIGVCRGVEQHRKVSEPFPAHSSWSTAALRVSRTLMGVLMAPPKVGLPGLKADPIDPVDRFAVRPRQWHSGPCACWKNRRTECHQWQPSRLALQPQ